MTQKIKLSRRDALKAAGGIGDGCGGCSQRCLRLNRTRQKSKASGTGSAQITVLVMAMPSIRSRQSIP